MMFSKLPAAPNKIRKNCEKNIKVHRNKAWNIQKAIKPCWNCPPRATINEEPTRDTTSADAILIITLAPNSDIRE
ncbi:hypothetical protein D3C80_2113920 [compost metagenome]